MSNQSDLSLLTVSSGLIDPNYLNIGHRSNSKQRLNKSSREASPQALELQRYMKNQFKICFTIIH